jgi:hypothetical protein
MNAPARLAPAVAQVAVRDLAWWAAERERLGTDWRSILRMVLRAVGAIEPCPVCGGEPCPSPSFCQLCREADAKAAPKRREGNSWPRPTPLTLIEAIKQSVRDRGIAALKEPATRERLSRCDAAALAEIDRWLQHRKRAAA